jgi:SAM-dependent methyltransferase
MDDRDLLDEQIEYYRRRAAEYVLTSSPPGDPHATHADRTREAIRALEPRGRVLELACGTGQWTGLLAQFADELLALDASPEMLELNRGAVRSARVRYEAADLFAWEPPHRFDVVFFGFWLSHVPMRRFAPFWELVARCLEPRTGRALFVDEGEHFEWREDWLDRDAGIVRRTLADGSAHRAVKVLWEPVRLQERLRELGWSAVVDWSGPFYWGHAHLNAEAGAT